MLFVSKFDYFAKASMACRIPIYGENLLANHAIFTYPRFFITSYNVIIACHALSMITSIKVEEVIT